MSTAPLSTDQTNGGKHATGEHQTVTGILKSRIQRAISGPSFVSPLGTSDDAPPPENGHRNKLLDLVTWL